MQKGFVICLFALVFLSAIDRLPAPIVEEPTPSSSATAKPKPSAPKKTGPGHKAEGAEKKVSPLAGTWEGSVTFSCSEGGGTWPSLTIAVGADGSSVQTQWLTDYANKSGPFNSRVTMNGSAIGWSFTAHAQALHEDYSYSFTLQRLSNSTASVVVHTFAAGGTCDGRAVLRRQ